MGTYRLSLGLVLVCVVHTTGQKGGLKLHLRTAKSTLFCSGTCTYLATRSVPWALVKHVHVQAHLHVMNMCMYFVHEDYMHVHEM